MNTVAERVAMTYHPRGQNCREQASLHLSQSPPQRPPCRSCTALPSCLVRWTLDRWEQGAGLGQLAALLRLCWLRMVILEQKVLKTGGWNRHRATCADNSREVEELSGGCIGAGGKEGTDAYREALPHERWGEEPCPREWPGGSWVPSLDI